MNRLALILFVAATAAGMSAATLAQTLYRWVDKDGRVHYSQQPPEPNAAKKVEERRMGPAPAAAPAGTTTSTQLPFSLQQAFSNFPVILYTAPGCKEGCSEARELLKKRGVPFREVSIYDDAGIAVLKRETGEARVPALTIGRTRQVGFEENALNGALDLAGYPRQPATTGPLPQPPEPEGLPKPQPVDPATQDGNAQGSNAAAGR